MIRRSSRGGSAIEFALLLPIIVSLLLGTLGIGVNLLRTQRTIQLARDAGHMYARGARLWLSGYQAIIARLGANVGLTTSPATSKAVVILSTITRVDKITCIAAGCPTDSSGNPTGCTNIDQWVFTRRVAIGNPGIRTSNFGAPSGVTVNPTDGSIERGTYASQNGYVFRTGARANFAGIDPYDTGTGYGLPSREVIYISEAASVGFGLPPITSPSVTAYSFSLF